jgi:hypothetical protein
VSKIGLSVAGVYVLAASWIAIVDARESATGGWITLKNMGAFLVTFPVSAPLAMMGMAPKLGNPWICGLMILLTAGLLYGIVRLFTSR